MGCVRDSRGQVLEMTLKIQVDKYIYLYTNSFAAENKCNFGFFQKKCHQLENLHIWTSFGDAWTAYSTGRNGAGWLHVESPPSLQRGVAGDKDGTSCSTRKNESHWNYSTGDSWTWPALIYVHSTKGQPVDLLCVSRTKDWFQCWSGGNSDWPQVQRSF